jgi:hypothetical protein
MFSPFIQVRGVGMYIIGCLTVDARLFSHFSSRTLIARSPHCSVRKFFKNDYSVPIVL